MAATLVPITSSRCSTGTGADAVGDEGLAAGEGEAVSAGHGERDTGDLVLERVRRG
ncbi:hypothetical protein [Micromonospora chalcea]|uniref:hypothetical protein n=1 Tax=Micromonospora chalcea TaxID=1874 RepID=UPI001FC97BCF|nr:hypothetical protein [Micromonospora chalcea]